MKRILLSFGSIIFVGGLLAGGTGAFLSDAGTSTGNTFASGLVNLQVDNESFATDQWGNLFLSTTTSWTLSDLTGKLFYNFLDIKPGDKGEDTVSLHVNNNNAWACMNINQTNAGAASSTALANNLYFVFWADDGDNVYEKGEKIFKEGYASQLFNGKNWTLADSAANVWSGTGPLLGDTTEYIGEAWCVGTSTPNPLPQDGKGAASNNGPLVRGTGFMCDGSAVGNAAQGNVIKADVSFNVVQSRNNNSFQCGDPGMPPPPVESTSTLFTDSFNSCQSGRQFDKTIDNQWDTTGDVDGNNQGGTHGLTAELEGKTSSMTSSSFSTASFHTITLSYDRMLTISGGTSATLSVQYSTDGGATWSTIESASSDSGWTTKTFSLSPGADNKANVKVRFSWSGSSTNDHAYIDNVLVTGVTP